MVLLLGLLLPVPALPETAHPQWTLRSSVDKTKLRLGEPLTLTIRVEGGDQALIQPRLPPLPGFVAVGTYQSVRTIGGKKTLLFHYLLKPTRTGRIAVPPFSLRVGGETRELPGFEVEVETAGSTPSRGTPSPGATPPGRGSLLGSDVFLSGALSVSKAYVGQPVTYTLLLYTRRSVRGLDLVKTPDFHGFRKIVDPVATRSPTRQVRRRGKLYLKAVVIRATLFPLKAGALVIDPYEAALRVDTRGFGGPSRFSVRGGAARLTVSPLPPPPPGFSGAVGSFTLSVLSAPEREQVLEKPFSLTLTVEGNGFLPEEPLGAPSSPLFRSYPPTVEETSGFHRGVYGVKRIVRLSFQPKVAGRVDLPPTSLVYFDPGRGRYKTLEAGGATLMVDSGRPKDTEKIRIAALIENPAVGAKAHWTLPRRLFWILLGLPFVGTALLALILWIYRAFLLDEKKRRIRTLRHEARRYLFRARRQLDVRKTSEFHEHLARALSAALDVRAGRPVAGLTRTEIGAVLEGAGLSPSTAREVETLAETLETARYAPKSINRREMQERYETVARWVKEGLNG